MSTNPNAGRWRVYLGKPDPRPATPFLLDGPLMTAIERRRAVTERMARDLIEAGALGSDQDAIRLLHACGYPMLDVALLAGEARMLAYQEIVAKEMSAP